MDFTKECEILEALAENPHENIVPCLYSWTYLGLSYMLFPLANGDLYHLLQEKPRPQTTDQFTAWLLRQLRGISDAIRYLHYHELLPSTENGERKGQRIGFHHDLKPANILVFRNENSNDTTWKVSDFGSGTVAFFSRDSSQDIYNVKPSTGDPIYSAPEFVSEGKVSLPKDIWSLGCIFLEVLLWVLDPSSDPIKDFYNERRLALKIREDHEPTYWYEVRAGLVDLNPAVARRLDYLPACCSTKDLLQPIIRLTRRMLTISHHDRPTAAEVCNELWGISQEHLS